MIEPATIDQLERTFKTQGAAAAVDELIATLKAANDSTPLFYSLLMKSRLALGVSPFPTGPSSDLPPEVHEPYEEAIRAAAREVGGRLLAANDIPRAWGFFRLINETQPVKDALEAVRPGSEDDVYPLIDIAFHQRLHPRRGFEILLEHHGVCSAITTLSGVDLSNDVPLRLDCIRQLIAALHAQLHERLAADLANRELEVPALIPEMLRDELFADEAYHIDVSHLSSVVQMSLELPAGDAALSAARDLCEYGQRLSPALRGGGDAPFEEAYADYGRFLALLAGENLDEGLKHFEAKAEREIADGNCFPAEVFINLLLRLERPAEALSAAKRFLAEVSEDTQLSCPSLSELARRQGDYAALADAARAKGDAVNFVAGLIAGGNAADAWLVPASKMFCRGRKRRTDIRVLPRGGIRQARCLRGSLPDFRPARV